jgi:anti-repressor protein
MEALIKIHDHKGQKLVDARELHEFLGNKREFANWIKSRILTYGFVEDQDFTSFDKNVKREKGASVRKEYALTLNMAKELSMVENNEKGKQARRYFIEMEQKAISQIRKEPSKKELAQWVIQLEEQKEALEMDNKLKESQIINQNLQIRTMQPKAELMERVMDLGDNVDVGQVAKILELPFGRNTLFYKLRQDGTFFKNRNEPKQNYVACGYFKLKEKVIERTDYPDKVVIKVLVTQKGLAWIAKKFESAIPKQSKMKLT